MSVGKVNEFDMKTGVWSSYIERLEMYFEVNKINSELKLPTLIAVMGDEAYELLVNLSSPKKPSTLKYEDAVNLLRNHLQPAPSTLSERFRFRQRRQSVDENIASYVAELKKITRFCKLGDNLNENLRDQFVCGLRSDLIRQRLFAEPDTLSFAEAVKLATTLEAAEKNAAAVDTRTRLNSGDYSTAVHSVAGIAASGERRRPAGRGGARGARGDRMSRDQRCVTMQSASAMSTGGQYNQNNNCRGCGASGHGYDTCRFRNYVCSRCRRVGHLRRVCPGLGMAGAPSGGAVIHHGEAAELHGGEEVISDFHHLCLNDYKAVSVPVYIQNKTLLMEIDTGTAVSCISAETYERHFRDIKMNPPSVSLNFYDGSTVQPIGVIKPNVRYGDSEKQLELFIVNKGTTSLLGRQWLTELNIKIPSFSNCNNIKLDLELQKLFDRYKDLFSGGLGQYTGGKATLRVREGATPVFHRARPIPYALRERVDAELDAMLRDGVIESVDCSDWASPLVPVSKADGSLRICADYKATVNPVLQVDRYPLPKIEDLIVRLSGSKYYSKIDLSQAYNQILLDDTKKITVINTHRGLYQYNRLVYGLASSPGIFQRIMSNLLSNIPNVEVFLDDILIGGRCRLDHLQAIEAVFSRLHKFGLKLKSNKCVFFVREIRYLGYILSKDGIKTDPDKIEAITKIPRPSNVTELRSFLGLVNFYGKFVRNMSSKLVSLYDLLKKGRQWHWSKECEQAFKEVKYLLTSAEVLAHYDPQRPLIVTCDASAKGLGCVLSQPSGDGAGAGAAAGGADRERPVAYASRTLNNAEKNYSQIHREALAIIFSVQKFHQYLYGRHFVLRTDHKPLVSIFGPHTGIPTMVASRMQRWAIILSAYSFDIEYVRTHENGADGLSRLPVVESKQMTHATPEQTYLHFVQQALLLDYNVIKSQTTRDPILSKVLSYLRDGWPSKCEIVNLQPYFNRRNELYEELGCIMWGHRLIVPECCKDKVLQLIHEPHMGIVKSKALARSYVWWPGLDEGVERMCRECEVCASQADAPPRQAPRMWPWPNQPWSRLHLDFMGPILNKTYLVVVDAMSKWIEVFHVSSTAASGVIDKISELFSKLGLPKQIVTDNGPPFTSSEFRNFTVTHGIDHVFTAPYHPSSNGLAENAVKTLKRVIKKAVVEKQNIDRALWTFLLHYRNTEHSTTGESPAMLLLGRRLRTKLDILKPDREATVYKRQKRQKEGVEGANRTLEPKDEVWYRQYLKGEKWVAGQVLDSLGPNNYKVMSKDGEIIHRHIDQLKRKSSRLSLAGPTTIVDQDISTSSQVGLEAQMEPESLPGEEQSEPSPTKDVDPQLGIGYEESPKDKVEAPASPVSHSPPSASKSPPSPPRRLVRKCRLKEISYK